MRQISFLKTSYSLKIESLNKDIFIAIIETIIDIKFHVKFITVNSGLAVNPPKNNVYIAL